MITLPFIVYASHPGTLELYTVEIQVFIREYVLCLPWREQNIASSSWQGLITQAFTLPSNLSATVIQGSCQSKHGNEEQTIPSPWKKASLTCSYSLCVSLSISQCAVICALTLIQVGKVRRLCHVVWTLALNTHELHHLLMLQCLLVSWHFLLVSW